MVLDGSELVDTEIHGRSTGLKFVGRGFVLSRAGCGKLMRNVHQGKASMICYMPVLKVHCFKLL